MVPNVKVILSQPIARFDGNPLPCLRVQHLIQKLEKLQVPLLNTRNIVRKHIGRKGLHFNDYGTARYAMNIISLIKRF